MLINTLEFAESLAERYKFFAGVPDSYLKDLTGALGEVIPAENFMTSVNEGSAVALCAGYNLATGLPGVLYMQNSGLGNIINPIMSLNDPFVYNIPLLMIIGWRGEPGTKDEPQHKKQGLVTVPLLEACGIPWKVLTGVSDLDWAQNLMDNSNTPVALLVKKDSFSKYSTAYKNDYLLSREEAIEAILDEITEDYRIISTTGMISRELYSLRCKRNKEFDRDFLTIGSMGHASSIALGLAKQTPHLKIICLDGDGAALMHMGSLCTIGGSDVSNFIHIILNNQAHDSVGGQPSAAKDLSFTGLAKTFGYTQSFKVQSLEDLKSALESCRSGRVLIEVKVALRSDSNLVRPPGDFIEQKNAFTKALKPRENINVI